MWPRCRSQVALSIGISIVALGCGSRGGGQHPGTVSGPTLTLIDSVKVQESDSIYIGRPYTPAIDPYDGTVYVPDFFSNRVYRFGRDGQLLRTYGRPGQGPGEFRSAEMTFVLDDSTLVVDDPGQERLEFFDRHTGDFRRERDLPLAPGTSAPVVTPDGIWMHAVSDGMRVGMAVWHPTRDTVTALGPLPGPYRASLDHPPSIFAQFFDVGGVVMRPDDTVVNGWSGLNWLYVHGLDGAVLDSVRVPAVRRRDVPPNLEKRMDSGDMGDRERYESGSGLLRMAALPGGGLVIVYHDLHILRLHPLPPTFYSTVWVSVVSPDLEEACVDARLPVSRDAESVEAFRGDTLFQFDRRIVGKKTARPRLQTWLRTFLVGTRGCDWLPTRPGH